MKNNRKNRNLVIIRIRNHGRLKPRLTALPPKLVVQWRRIVHQAKGNHIDRIINKIF